MLPASPDDGNDAVHHPLIQRPPDRVGELILGMHVQRNLGARIHPHEADLRVTSPDQPRLGGAAAVGLRRVGIGDRRPRISLRFTTTPGWSDGVAP